MKFKITFDYIFAINMLDIGIRIGYYIYTYHWLITVEKFALEK
jgi:hypothetical protein